MSSPVYLTKAFHRRARLALWGTIFLCGATTLQTFRAQSLLIESHRENNRTKYTEALRLRDNLQRNYVCSRNNLEEGRWYTLVSSAWNHGSGVHLLGNLLGLYSFGRIIAYTVGAGTFITIFYGGAVVGNLVCLGLDRRFGSVRAEDALSGDGEGMGRQHKRDLAENRESGGFIGASGGVCAMTAANACVNPLGRMIIGIMFIPVPVPNWLGVGAFSAFSAWAQTNNFQSGVAHLGHLGGVVYGVVWFLLKTRGRK